MRVLFFMRSTVYVRNFESTLRLLAERGHDVHVVAEPHSVLDPTDLMGRLTREHANIRHSLPPSRLGNQWSRVGFELRAALDYLRYLEPEYQDAPKLRRRAEEKAPAFVTEALQRPLVNTPRGRRMLARLLHAADRAVPRNPVIDEFIRAQSPDLVLVTPLVEPGSPQSEYVRSAQALGVRVGLCVYSWDNLTNKGLVHDRLDLITVWNPMMKDEAVTLHHVPARRVIVTGAAAYDHWFTWTPRTTREEFCARVGLRADRPYLLYLCSSKFIAPDELTFIRKWIAQIRASSPTLADCGVLVRPHPQNTEMWWEVTLAELGNAVVWPPAGGNPVDTDSRADYYDSIHHSAAVVGVNTSAQIESAIVGRGVYTVLAPEFRETQEGTLHFRHLRDVNGGLLNIAADFPEHVRQLEAAIHDPQRAVERCRRFVEAFIRPHGIDEPATPRLVAALEAVAAQRPRRVRDPLWAPLVRPSLERAAASLVAAEPARGLRRAAAALVEPRQEGAAPRPPRKKLRRVDRVKAEAAGTAQQAYEHYLQVRGHVERMRAAVNDDTLTPSELHLREALADLWQATPETFAELRHHCKAITGIRRSDYKGPKADGVKARLERDLLRVMDKSDPALLIEEPLALGGFGFTALGKRYNEETLRFLRVLSLLDDAALVKEFATAKTRRTVWEIGGGWGGFAYQFKTTCPNVTYLITGLPDLFLVSAVYVMTMFPSARVRFYDPERPDAFWEDWEHVDFAFAPERAVAEYRAPSLDLTLDLMSLERMSAPRIHQHVRTAYERGCRYFFSLCPAHDEGTEPSPVRDAIERLYWPHPVSAPLYVGKRLALGGEKRAGRRGAVERTYVLGWRRLRA